MDGIILIDKEKGISSFGAVSKVRKIFNTKKVGHCGTLDPEATGVLPIMIGQATKVSKYLVEHDKEYVAILKLGIKTDSGDSEGNVIDEENFALKNENEKIYIERIKEMVGKSMQVPPMYSAIKVNGKKLYEYAREGKEVERQEREIEIYSIDVENLDYENNEITFRVKCSKGTYIRTLCETIAERIGTVGYMKALNRTKVDNFDIRESVKLSELEESVEKEKYVITLEKIFEKNDSINLDNRKKDLFLNGVKLTFKVPDGVYKIYNNDKFLGLGIVKNELLKRDVIVEENSYYEKN